MTGAVIVVAAGGARAVTVAGCELRTGIRRRPPAAATAALIGRAGEKELAGELVAPRPLMVKKLALDLRGAGGAARLVDWVSSMGVVTPPEVLVSDNTESVVDELAENVAIVPVVASTLAGWDWLG